MRSAPQDTHANCEARSSSTEHARKVKESRKENCTSRWRGRNAREAQDVWATCCLQVNLLLSNVFGFSPLSLSYSILFSLFVLLFFPFPYLLFFFFVFEPLGLFIVKLFLCSSVFFKYPDLNSLNLSWTKRMSSVGRIGSYIHFNPNKRTPAKFSILYHT